jgi:hypothetical protein
MAQERTFKVVEWEDLPDGTEVIRDFDLRCECGREAICPMAKSGVLVEARIGMSFIFSPATPPPEYWLPRVLKCRRCGREYDRGGREQNGFNQKGK